MTNTRHALAQYVNKKVTLTGTVTKIHLARNFNDGRGQVCLNDVHCMGAEFDHLWGKFMSHTLDISKLEVGKRYTFTGTGNRYTYKKTGKTNYSVQYLKLK